MMTVNEVSKLTGVSIRTLQYYDNIGLLVPVSRSESGYRLYDYNSLEILQQILLFRELEFPLQDIKKIINNPDYDKEMALEQQIKLLILKRDHFDELISLALDIKNKGERKMDFKAFDNEKIEKYTKDAKELWGDTKEFIEFEKKDEAKTPEERESAEKQIMIAINKIGRYRDKSPENMVVQVYVKKLRDFITENYYNCTNEIFSQLGEMYGAGGEFTKNIDSVCGEGSAVFVSKAIAYFCKNNG